jgi:hypothetical protein
MSMFTKMLSAVDEAALAAANAAANAALPESAPPLTDHEYLSAVIDQVLASYQDQYIRITSGAFLLRFPPGKIDQIKAAAADSPQLAAHIAEIEASPYVYIGSAVVRGGIAALVQTGLLTQVEADAILS